MAAITVPTSVSDTLSQLLTKRAAIGETVIVLGGSSLFDSPVRIAKHFPTIVYPIDNIVAFPAVGGGEWYLVSLGTTASGEVQSQAVTADDGTVHDFLVLKVASAPDTYALAVEQTVSVGVPGIILLLCDDGTKHYLRILKDPATGKYVPKPDQADSSGVPTTLRLICSTDSTTHEITIVALDVPGVGTVYQYSVSQ